MRPFFAQPRDYVYQRLQELLTQEKLEELGVSLVPELSVGGKPSEPPCEVIVRELPTSVTYDIPSTCPVPTITWTIEVDLIATNADLVKASDAVLAYADALSQLVSTDIRLGGSVMRSEPLISSVGTSSATGKRYVAAIAAGIRCTGDFTKWKETA